MIPLQVRMKIRNLKQLDDRLRRAVNKSRRTAILTHKNPDGDGIGSALALQEYFLQMGRESDVVMESKLPINYSFLAADKRITIYNSDLIYDNLILVDCHELIRLGRCRELVETAEIITTIDHHIQGNLIPGSGNYIRPGEPCAALILYKMMIDELSSLPGKSRTFIATCIYTAILNDTDNFMNLNTSAEIFSICSRLCDLGVDPGPVSEQIFYRRTVPELRYIGSLFSSIETGLEGKVLILISTSELRNRHGLNLEANSKLTRWLKGAVGVKLIIFLQEKDSGGYRVSLRSKTTDVKAIAEKFGGGGHKRAAGCEINLSLDRVKTELLKEIGSGLK